MIDAGQPASTGRGMEGKPARPGSASQPPCDASPEPLPAPNPHVPAGMPHLAMVGGRKPAQPSPSVTVALSKARSLRCRIEGTQWVIEVQRYRQGAARRGQWFEGRGVVLSMAVRDACADQFSEREQAEVCRYLGAEFYRLAEPA